MNKQVKKYIINIAILIVVTALALFFVLKDDAGMIFESLKNANVWYLLACFGLILLSYLAETLILFILARLYNPEYKLLQGFWNFMIGRFFSGITPSATGGQFAQAYTFSKQGVKLTSASSIMVMMFITYQIGMNIFGAITLIYSTCTNSIPTGGIDIFGIRINIFWLSIIGFIIIVMIVLFMILLSTNKTIHRVLINIVIALGKFFHIIKKNKVEEKRIEMNAQVEVFRMELKRLLSNIKILVTIVGLYLIVSLTFNMIPFYAFKACNVDLGYNNFFHSISYSTFTYLITQLIPIPGASGGAEYVFNLMYGQYVPNQVLLKSVILIWRFATFYFGLLLGGLVVIFYHQSPKLETLHYSDRTLLEIQVIHLNDEYTKEKNEVKMAEPIKMEEVESYFENIKKELASNLKANSRSLTREENKRKKKLNEENK